MRTIRTVDVLVVGDGTGGAAAAIQAARRGAQTALVTELPWLGGMLTAAGVAAPDGNELRAFQTGIWGAFLEELQRRQPGGLANAWVSFFTYEPRIGAAIMADWVKALPNLQWFTGKAPRAVIRSGDRILGVAFDEVTIRAKITLDGTELGDLLALGDVPYRWGWETQGQFNETSAPPTLSDPTDLLYKLTQTYPVQAPTWVVVMRDAGQGNAAPMIKPAMSYDSQLFQDTWEGYGPQKFLTYGQLPGKRFMLNWPQQGNDYGVNLARLIQSEQDRRAWAEEAIAHSQNFAHFIQTELGQRYGLATDTFPQWPNQLGGGAFALQPYYRESRRLVGIKTVTERDILPAAERQVAPLPINAKGAMSAIAIGNYPNDHHYPSFTLPLANKSMHWGGRWTGTPFAIPYEAIVPATTDGLLVCDKNLSVSHIANGATRLQPVVLGIGQAAGLAAALCVEQGCEPRDLPVLSLQTALLTDEVAPAAVVPILDCPQQHSHWRRSQEQYQRHPETYLINRGLISPSYQKAELFSVTLQQTRLFEGTLEIQIEPKFWQAKLHLLNQQILTVLTLDSQVHQALQALRDSCKVELLGIPNWPSRWLQVVEISRIF